MKKDQNNKLKKLQEANESRKNKLRNREVEIKDF